MEYIKIISNKKASLHVGSCEGCCFFDQAGEGDCLDIGSDRVCWDIENDYIFKEKDHEQTT